MLVLITLLNNTHAMLHFIKTHTIKTSQRNPLNESHYMTVMVPFCCNVTNSTSSLAKPFNGYTICCMASAFTFMRKGTSTVTLGTQKNAVIKLYKFRSYYQLCMCSLRINYFSTIALWAFQVEFSTARLKF